MWAWILHAICHDNTVKYSKYPGTLVMDTLRDPCPSHVQLGETQRNIWILWRQYGKNLWTGGGGGGVWSLKNKPLIKIDVRSNYCLDRGTMRLFSMEHWDDAEGGGAWISCLRYWREMDNAEPMSAMSRQHQASVGTLCFVLSDSQKVRSAEQRLR